MKNLKSSLDDFLQNISKSVTSFVTFVFVDMQNSTALKQTRSPESWVIEMGKFYNTCTTRIEEQQGEVVKFLGDGVLALFDNSTDALNCAIKIQEGLLKQRAEAGFSTGTIARIGVATGKVYKITLENNSDYLGEAIDIAAKLCGFTNGNGITLDKVSYDFAKVPLVESNAGKAVNRTTSEYFSESSSMMIGKKSIPYQNLHWGLEKDYIVSEPLRETSKDTTLKPARKEPLHHEDRSEYGTVKFYKPNNFGFIVSDNAKNKDKGDVWFGSRSLIVSDQSVVQANCQVYYHRQAHERSHDSDVADSVVVIGDVLQGKVTCKFGERGFAFLQVIDPSDNSNLRVIFFGSDVKFHHNNDLEGLFVKFEVGAGHGDRGIHALNILLDEEKKVTPLKVVEAENEQRESA